MTFHDFCRSLGIIPPESFTPGRWQRVANDTNPRKKNANVKLLDCGTIGFAIDFSTMTEAATWKAGEENKIVRSEEENAALTERLALRRAEEAKGTMRAQTLYAESEPLRFGNHPYLIRKKLDQNGCRGIKIDKEGWLVIPVYRDRKLISVQRISPDGDKRFQAGAPVKGGHYQIWRPGAVVTVLCEGFATGLAIFAAMPLAKVEVCFSAGNMVQVAKREDWSGLVAVASDHDRYTEERDGKNPGIEAAKEASASIGCGWAAPTCEGTDWHDFYMERLAILEKAEQEKAFPRSPRALRDAALLPIRLAIMAAAKKV